MDNRQGLIGFMFTILLFVQSIHNYISAHTPLPDDPTQPWHVGMGRLLGPGPATYTADNIVVAVTGGHSEGRSNVTYSVTP